MQCPYCNKNFIISGGNQKSELQCPYCNKIFSDNTVAVSDVCPTTNVDTSDAKKLILGHIILSRYEILSQLGEGGNGVIYRCLDKVAGVDVAIKLLRSELAANPAEIANIRENFKLVAKLIHQNIAVYKNLERDDTNGNYYLIMECIDGENLRHWMTRQHSNQDWLSKIADCLPILKQVASALDYAHAEQIVHRDIKPSNIMVDGCGRVKVLDWGSAVRVNSELKERKLEEGFIVGTEPYMSPEQWQRKPLDAASDQYSLAAMTYEMLSGHLPFDDQNVRAMCKAVLFYQVPYIDKIPAPFNKILAKALSKVPEERYESCAAFIQTLEQTLKTFQISHVNLNANGDQNNLVKNATVPSYPEVLSEKKVTIGKETSIPEVEHTKTAKLKGSLLHRIPLVFNLLKIPQKFILIGGGAVFVIGITLALVHFARSNSDSEVFYMEQQKKDAELKREVLTLHKKLSVFPRELSPETSAVSDEFHTQLDIFCTNYESADAAIAKCDFNLACEQLKNAEKAANWIQKNEQLAEKYLQVIKDIEALQVTLEEYQASSSASFTFSEACRKVAQAKEEFRSGNYEAALYDAKNSLDTFMVAKAEAEKVYLNNLTNKLRAIDVQSQIEDAKEIAQKILKIDPEDNEACSVLERVKDFKPSELTLIATYNGKEVPAVVFVDKNKLITPTTVKLEKNKKYIVRCSYQEAAKEYTASMLIFCNWTGKRSIHLPLMHNKAQELHLQLPEHIFLEMVKVEKGSFLMSHKDGCNERGEEEHKVVFTHDFYIGKFEVSQEQYSSIIKNSSCQRDLGSRHLPANYISWHEAMYFCERLNDEKIAPMGWRFSLPTEAQWEYAAQGGKNNTYFRYSGSDDLEFVSWSSIHGRTQLHPVFAVKHSNSLGIYGMSGNVSEWCLDDWHEKSTQAVPEFYRQNDESGMFRVHRGGSIADSAKDCRVAKRAQAQRMQSDKNIGFRLALVPDSQSRTLSDHANSENVSNSSRTLEKELKITLTGNVVLQLQLIPKGAFIMGSKTGKKTEENSRWVKIEQDFYLGQYEISQEQYEQIMKQNPSRNRGNLFPVEQVSWHDAVLFCNRLNAEGYAPVGWTFALPTEAQWEYAARGGRDSHGFLYSGSNWLDQVAWYAGNSQGHAHAMNQKKAPNELGLYNMSGNVWEWCMDDWKPSINKKTVTAATVAHRVVRGGSWDNNAENCTVTYRMHFDAHKQYERLGFRVALIRTSH